MNPIWFGKVEKGKVRLYRDDQFKNYLITLENKDIELVVRKWQKTRTNKQNSYLWGVVYNLISETTGYTLDETHDAMRMLFLMDKTKTIPTLKSTTQLSTIEFNEYIENIKQWAILALNCNIPDPNEVEA